MTEVTSLRRLKYIVQAVAVEIDGDGNIVGERTTQPQAVYTSDQLLELVESLDLEIAATSLQGSANGANPEQ
jgi:hypothetical protein